MRSPFLNDDVFFKALELGDDGILKARATKYTSRKRVGNKWVYEYVDKQGVRRKGNQEDFQKFGDPKKSFRAYDPKKEAEENKKLEEKSEKEKQEKKERDKIHKKEESKTSKKVKEWMSKYKYSSEEKEMAMANFEYKNRYTVKDLKKQYALLQKIYANQKRGKDISKFDIPKEIYEKFQS